LAGANPAESVAGEDVVVEGAAAAVRLGVCGEGKIADTMFPRTIMCVSCLLLSRRHSHRLQPSHQSARYYSFDASDHSRCFRFGRQPAVWGELIDQGRQMLTETGEQVLTFHARLFA
jgi:hypothetical protein